eukprot:g12965.t3
MSNLQSAGDHLVGTEGTSQKTLGLSVDRAPHTAAGPPIRWKDVLHLLGSKRLVRWWRTSFENYGEALEAWLAPLAVQREAMPGVYTGRSGVCPADAAVLNPVEPNDLLLLSEAAAEGLRSPTYFQMLRDLVRELEMPNVTVISRYRVNRGGVSTLTAWLGGMSWLLEHVSEWDYYINLNDSDYPVAKLESLQRFLTMALNSPFCRRHVRWGFHIWDRPNLAPDAASPEDQIDALETSGRWAPVRSGLEEWVKALMLGFANESVANITNLEVWQHETGPVFFHVERFRGRLSLPCARRCRLTGHLVVEELAARSPMISQSEGASVIESPLLVALRVGLGWDVETFSFGTMSAVASGVQARKMDGVSLNMLQVLLAIILAAASISLLTSAGVIHRCPMCPGATGISRSWPASSWASSPASPPTSAPQAAVTVTIRAPEAVVFIAGWCGEVCSGKDMGHLEAEDDKSFRERPPQELEVRWLGPRHRPSITWRSSWSSQLVSWAPMPSEGRVEPGEWKLEALRNGIVVPQDG